ncbi:MAG TPA: PIN domain-containing protein [Pyrinomonadaceae bacterium]|nr:PIN domain-containing protein [Pyrinomonadaceae bacterium]
MNAVDTNVLIYARDPRDPVKQQKARALTANLTDGALLWQVACEFIAASRKLTAVGYTQAQALGELERLRVLWKLILPSDNVFVRAEQLTTSHKLLFWDAMIVAACMEGSITRLYTEDFDNSFKQMTGVEIVNPF